MALVLHACKAYSYGGAARVGDQSIEKLSSFKWIGPSIVYRNRISTGRVRNAKTAYLKVIARNRLNNLTRKVYAFAQFQQNKAAARESKLERSKTHREMLQNHNAQMKAKYSDVEYNERAAKSAKKKAARNERIQKHRELMLQVLVKAKARLEEIAEEKRKARRLAAGYEVGSIGDNNAARMVDAYAETAASPASEIPSKSTQLSPSSSTTQSTKLKSSQPTPEASKQGKPSQSPQAASISPSSPAQKSPSAFPSKSSTSSSSFPTRATGAAGSQQDGTSTSQPTPSQSKKSSKSSIEANIAKRKAEKAEQANKKKSFLHSF